MPKAKKPLIHHPFHRSTILLAFILLFFSFILWLVFAKRLQDSTQVPLRGDLSATVRFTGLPCGPKTKTKTTPPCNGLYPNYLVKIYNKNNSLVASSLSDSEGKISLNLAAGDYYWQKTSFTILPNQVTVKEFIVDTGIR